MNESVTAAGAAGVVEKAAGHTPGPWVVTQLARINVRSVVVDADGGRRRIAKIALSATLPETDQANARLIAAAPELLSALEDVVRIAARDTAEFNRARAAIRKAKGETP